MLLGSNLLEVAIGMIFVYLLLSLLCSALNELIESFIKFRARDLQRGIVKLLNDEGLAKQLFNHPLIKPLGNSPSYIPARTFSLALWNLATTQAEKGKDEAAGVTQDLTAIRGLIAGMGGNGQIQTALLTLIDEAGNDINKARANVEEWYNDAMDRVSGLYKRRTHWILIVMGLAAAAVLNIDTLTVAKALWFNDTLRRSVAVVAEDYAKTKPLTAPATSGTPDTPEGQAAEARQKIGNISGQLNSLGLPIGWPIKPQPGDSKYRDIKDDAVRQKVLDSDLAAYNADVRWWAPGENYSGALLKLMGIFLTALAVSQGAPFWFDFLNKFIVIRSTVKPHEKSPMPPSKDSPAPETLNKVELKDQSKG